jgi:hypothetical protein
MPSSSRRFQLRRPLGRALALATLLAVALSALLAGPAAAADAFTPDVDITLPPGGAHDVAKTLTLDGLPNQADILFAIDTTGSMDSAIQDARGEVTRMVAAFKERIPDPRFAVADFKDYPVDPFDGGDPDAYPYRLRQPMTADPEAVESAISVLSASGGGDTEESYTRVFYEAVNDAAIGYRSGAARFLLVLGDAPPHTGDNSVAACGITDADPGRDGQPGTADDLQLGPVLDALRSSNTKLLMLAFQTDASVEACYQALAAVTGGGAASYEAAGGDDLINTVLRLVADASRQVDVTFQTDPEDCPIRFEFDPPRFDDVRLPATLEVEEHIIAPTAPGTTTCTVHALADGEVRATQTVRIAVPDTSSSSTTTTTTTTVPSSSTTTTSRPAAPATSVWAGPATYPPANPPSRLPFTGGSVLSVLAAGALLLVTGTVLLRSGRFRPRRARGRR